MGLETSLKYKP